MLDFITNAKKHISTNINKKYKEHVTNLKSKMGDTPCVQGYNYKECVDNKNKKKLEKINQRNKKIIDRHKKIESPGSYTKVLNGHYHTGVINTSTGSTCNANLNNVSHINKYTYAMVSSKPILHDGYSKKSDIQGHHVDCSSKCREHFSNIDGVAPCHNNKRTVNILLLILLIICLIPYLYFFIKQFMGKGKKKY
jgi:hypothetical protein